VTKAQTGADVTTYTYAAAAVPTQRVARVGASVTTYTYEYDIDERLTRVTASGPVGYEVSYEDDHDRRRIRRAEVGGSTDVYHHDGEDIVVEDPSSGDDIVYTHGPMGLVSRRQGATSKFYQSDGLGSTRKIMKADETFDAFLIYDAWGNLASGSADADPYLWVGRLGYRRDGDLYHLRARMYDPREGRFLTRDPIIRASALETLLQYAGNAPLRFADPIGMQRSPTRHRPQAPPRNVGSGQDDVEFAPGPCPKEMLDAVCEAFSSYSYAQSALTRAFDQYFSAGELGDYVLYPPDACWWESKFAGKLSGTVHSIVAVGQAEPLTYWRCEAKCAGLPVTWSKSGGKLCEGGGKCTRHWGPINRPYPRGGQPGLPIVRMEWPDPPESELGSFDGYGMVFFGPYILTAEGEFTSEWKTCEVGGRPGVGMPYDVGMAAVVTTIVELFVRVSSAFAR
jgi:RHS repeat-associated protein